MRLFSSRFFYDKLSNASFLSRSFYQKIFIRKFGCDRTLNIKTRSVLRTRPVAILLRNLHSDKSVAITSNFLRKSIRNFCEDRCSIAYRFVSVCSELFSCLRHLRSLLHVIAIAPRRLGWFDVNITGRALLQLRNVMLSEQMWNHGNTKEQEWACTLPPWATPRPLRTFTVRGMQLHSQSAFPVVKRSLTSQIRL